MLKHCTTCGADVELSQWHRHRASHRRNGKGANRNQKLAAKARAGNACVHCGNVEDLEVHHRDGNWRNNSPTNLIALCPTCHAEADEEIRRDRLRRSQT